MKLFYYADTDSLYIDLAERPGVTSEEVLPGVVLDLDEQGALVGTTSITRAPGWTCPSPAAEASRSRQSVNSR